MVVADAPDRVQIQLFGWQGPGPRGFVNFGTANEAKVEEWADYLYLLAHGGRGSGKSKAGAIRAVRYMLAWPGSLGVVTAPTYDMLHSSTLIVFMETLDQFGFVRDQDYVYNHTREEIVLRPVNSKVIFRTTEKPERLRGMSIAWFWMDEPRESPLVAFQNLQACMRQQGYPHQGWCTTTPVGKRHWTYGMFYRRAAAREGYLAEHGLTERVEGARFVAYPARTRDNPFGGEALYQQMIATYGEDSAAMRQEMNGEFVLMAGLVYDGWNPARHVLPKKDWPGRPEKIIAGVDFGFRNPSAIIVEGLDRQYRRYLLRELYRPGLSEQELVREASALGKQYGIQLFICDSADPGWIKALRRGGLPARAVKKKTVGSPNNPSSGIALCSLTLRRTLDDGSGMFFVDPACENFRREIESYVWDEAKLDMNLKEVPRKYGDHLMDAWRYAETTIARLWDREAERLLKIETSRLITTEIN